MARCDLFEMCSERQRNVQACCWIDYESKDCWERRLMSCGHPKAYRRTETTYLRSDAMGGQEQGPLVTYWCAACEAEAQQQEQEAPDGNDDAA